MITRSPLHYRTADILAAFSVPESEAVRSTAAWPIRLLGWIDRKMRGPGRVASEDTAVWRAELWLDQSSLLFGGGWSAATIASEGEPEAVTTERQQTGSLSHFSFPMMRPSQLAGP